MRITIPFLLASTSPRRRHLLEVLGIPFSVVTESVSEELDAELTPERSVEALAIRKADAVASSYPESLVLGADTIVVVDDTVLGKPAGRDEAVAMLTRLSGRTHTVFTGLALVCREQDRRSVAHETTEVTFAPLTADEIETYVASGSPMDKAGAYGIQEDLGAAFVSSVRGDFYTVVGLPLHRLYRMLRTDFADLLAVGPGSA